MSEDGSRASMGGKRNGTGVKVMSDKDEDIVEAVKAIESNLSLPEGFVDGLIREDDWSFVIKSHALIEATLSTWIASSLNKEQLLELLSHLDIGNMKYGKIAFTKALALTTEYDRRFLKGLSELRNRLVHQVSNVGFNFSEYIDSLDPSQKKSFVKAFGYNYWGLDDEQKITEPDMGIVLKNPKESIWHGVRLFLAIVGITMDTHKLKLEAEKLEKERLEKELEIERRTNKGIKALMGNMSDFLKNGPSSS